VTDSLARLTGQESYFEDFQVGDVIEHARGKTITEMDNVLLTNLVLNTSQGHFNEQHMQGSQFGQRITFGGITAAMIIGLASQDTSENSLKESAVTGIRFLVPVVHGDTLYAFSEVVETIEESQSNAGTVVFRHWGINQDDKVVFEGQRRVQVKKRNWWGSA
jgi:itaconyl-CoA hydratase